MPKKAIPDLSSGESDNSDDEVPTIKVNEAFKRRFEAQEQKRELSYLQSKGLLEVRVTEGGRKVRAGAFFK